MEGIGTIKSILMKRDEMTEEEADEAIEDAKEDLYNRMAEGEMPFNICEEHFQLEMDYIDELY